jgi:hypothetical protein
MSARSRREHRRLVLANCERIDAEVKAEQERKKKEADEKLRRQLIASLAKELDIEDCTEVYGDAPV